ncbi:hypothetical protein [Aquamicrobium sp.]|uniref:hypothetical protein n=1 Tax=Aquamicrobium sp. TaxID=1872579 RepID=UPI00258C516E|nr:hypothetical protein [Aquamicrobium sp.]MCK9550249.1 hypothetical protein [Aquamicrobium sp.]
MSFGFYSDAGLTVPFTENIRHISTQGDRLLYYGDPVEGRMLQDASAPGSANIMLSVFDSAAGSGAAASWVKLASTSGGLTGATPGAALSLGATILSGVASAKPVHMRIDASEGEEGDRFTDLRLRLSNVVNIEV